MTIPSSNFIPNPNNNTILPTIIDQGGNSYVVWTGGFTGQNSSQPPQIGIIQNGQYVTLDSSTLLASGWSWGPKSKPSSTQLQEFYNTNLGGSPSPTSPVSQTSGSQPSQSSQIAAQLLRAQYDDWKQLFQPIELGQMQQLSFNNPQVLNTAVNKAGAAATGASSAMTGIAQRTNRALGVAPSESQTNTSRRLMDLNKATNLAGAENTARANVRLQDQLILLGSAPNPNIVSSII